MADETTTGDDAGTRDVASAVGATGFVRDVAMLDLTTMHSADDLAAITRIQDVAVILVPESLASTLMRIPMQDVATVIPVPDGADVKLHTGSVTLGGDALAGPRGDDDVLLVTGNLIISSPVSQVSYRQVIVTGMVLAPRGSESALGAGLTRVTGSVHYYRWAQEQEIVSQSGQFKMSGEALANPGGNKDDVLVVAGQLIVTSPVQEIGYQRVFIPGQLVGPRESEPLISSTCTVQGQTAWYSGRSPRFFVGAERFAAAFFELLDEPITLVLIGKAEFEPDVPPELLREKVHEIVLIGKITAPGELVPVLQLLSIEKYGKITAGDDEPGAE